MKKKLCLAFALALLANAKLHAATPNFCGELSNAYGPFDYRKRGEFQENFRLVENGHFTPEVENGIKGKSGTLGSDIDYTLRAIPNHHRALATLATVAMRDKSVQIVGMRYPVECWFNRAIRFTPDDSAVYVSYGGLLFASGKINEATEIFKQGIAYDPDNVTLNYNIALAYLKKQDYASARVHGKKAYSAGFPLQGLKNKLIELGQWDTSSNN